MKKLNIMYDFLIEPGGLERVMATQVRNLQKYFDVKVSFANIDCKSDAFLFFKNFKILSHSLNFLMNGDLKVMYSFLIPKVAKSDLNISHSFICSRICFRMKQGYGIPYIIYLHHPPLFLYLSREDKKEWMKLGSRRRIAALAATFFGSLLRWMDKRYVRNANGWFVNSNYTKNRIKRIYGVDAEVCYPTLDKKFKVLLMKKVDSVLKKFKLNRKYLFTCGRIIPDKRFDFAVEVISKLDDMDLVIAGSVKQDYKNFLVKLAKKRNCLDRVRFVGFVDSEDFVSLYNGAEVFICTPPQEDFGLVPIESMACGTPVVAWGDGAGPSETVLDGVNGYLCKPYDVNDVVEKVNKILKSDFKRKNKKKILDSVKKFSEENQMKIFYNGIKKVL